MPNSGLVSKTRPREEDSVTEQVMEEAQTTCQQKDYRRPGVRCSRPATVFEKHLEGMSAEWVSAYCDEHTRVHEHARGLDDWSLAYDLATEWLEEARELEGVQGRQFGDLCQRVEALVEECRARLDEVTHRHSEAQHFADRAMVETEQAV